MPESASRGGSPSEGAFSIEGGFSMGGLSIWGGGGFLHPARGGLLARPPPVNRMTDRCKNITLAKTLFRPVIKLFSSCKRCNKNGFQWNAYCPLADCTCDGHQWVSVVGVGTHSSLVNVWGVPPEIPTFLRYTLTPLDIPTSLEGTWDQRYPPTPRKDMGQGILTPSPVNRMTDTRLRKHYLPATTVAGGKISAVI